MGEIENALDRTPKHLILEDRVYNLSVYPAQNSGRASNRGLVDYHVEGTNPLTSSDKWQTLLGMSEEIYEDYTGFRIQIPLGWILFRFLCHHVRASSIHILKGPGGQVLTSTSFKTYLGSIFADEQADEMLRTVLMSWARSFPGEPVVLEDLFVSTDITFDMLKRSINALIFQDQIKKVSEYTYNVKSSIFSNSPTISVPISFDRKSNRYYQEISIQADEPFCFVVMPFREKEFQQSIYHDVIRPLIEEEFNISCYRVKDDFLPDRIDNKIYSYILRAAFVVAEVTTRNPNVLYEIGLSHMLEKDCIILTQTPNSEVPFDINRISAEPYENEEALKSYLRKTISALGFKLFR